MALGNKLCSFVGRSLTALMLAVGFGGAALSAMAEDVARVMVVQNNAYVRLYTIDDNNQWTQGATIVTAGANAVTKRPMRAIYRDGVVYVLDMIADQSEYGYIRKYTLDGEYLGDVCRLDVRLDDFIFSPDGRYIYVSVAFGANAGKIYRYDTQMGASELFAHPGGNTRQLTWGPDGRLYVADRTGAIKGVDISTKEVKKLTLSNVGAASGLYYDAVSALFYVSDTSGNVRSVTAEGSVASIGQPTPGRQCVWCTRLNGAMHFFSLNASGLNALGVRMTGDKTFSSDIEYAGSFCSAMEIPLVLPDLEWKLDEEANSLVYKGENTDITISPMRLLQSGVTGVKGAAVWFNARSYGRMDGSETMIPAVDDFTVSFWAALSQSAALGRTLFSNAKDAPGGVAVAVGAEGKPNQLTLSFVKSDGDCLTAISESDFADGEWHHVALCRKGARLVAYVDGAEAATLTLPEEAAISQSVWNIGAAGAGAVMDDLRLYRQALTARAIAGLAAEFSPGAIPASAPDMPEAAGLPSALGTEVLHRYAIDGEISEPMLFKAPDGSFYAACGRGDGCETEFLRSADGGSTWTRAAPALAAGSVSLFGRDGGIFALGLKHAGAAGASQATFAVWELAQGAWTEKLAFAGSADNTYALGAGAVAFYNTDKRFYKTAVCYYGGTNAYPAYVSFAYANGVFSDGVVQVTANNGASVVGPNPANNQPSTCTVADVLPGDALIMGDNSCNGFYSFVDGTDDKLFRAGPERTRNVRFNSRTGYTNLSAWMLPGGSKPYAIAYDGESRLYWAVTSPDAKRLNAYASPDLAEWWPCGEVLEPANADVRFVSMALDGDDLAVVYGVAADDDAGGALGASRPNYLAFRRVPGFRTALVPEKPDGRYLISANGSTVKRYWRTSGGEWLPGGNFASGTYAGVALGLEVAIAASGNAVYVGGEQSKGRIFVFDRKGTYRRTLEMPDATNGKIDSISIAANGRDLIVADAFAKQAVYRVDPSSGTWTELVSTASTAGTEGALGGRVRGAIEAPDGTLYVAANNGVFAFGANGALVKKFASGAHVGLALDAEGNRLFYSNQGGAIVRADLASDAKTTVQTRSMGANSALQLVWHDGRLLAADARNYYAYAVNHEALNEEEVFLFGFEGFARFAFVDENFQPGIVIRLK